MVPARRVERCAAERLEPGELRARTGGSAGRRRSRARRRRSPRRSVVRTVQVPRASSKRAPRPRCRSGCAAGGRSCARSAPCTRGSRPAATTSASSRSSARTRSSRASTARRRRRRDSVLSRQVPPTRSRLLEDREASRCRPLQLDGEAEPAEAAADDRDAPPRARPSRHCNFLPMRIDAFSLRDPPDLTSTLRSRDGSTRGPRAVAPPVVTIIRHYRGIDERPWPTP